MANSVITTEDGNSLAFCDFYRFASPSGKKAKSMTSCFVGLSRADYYMQKVVTKLWFDGPIEEAIELYTSCFENARISSTTRYAEVGMGKDRRQHDHRV